MKNKNINNVDAWRMLISAVLRDRPEIKTRKEIATNAKLIYLDQNIISRIGDDEINLLMANDEYQFVYSPAHGEEVFRVINEESRCKLIKLVKALTLDRSVQPNTPDTPLMLCAEPFEHVVTRCSEDREATECVEKLKMENIERNKEVDRNILISVNNSSCIFDAITDDEFRSLIKKSRSYPPAYYKGGFSNLKNHEDLNNAIYTLHNVMDVLNYKVDRNERAQRSSLYDIEHCKYASYCDFFVTEDKRLFHRAREIFHFIECNTRVINKGDMLRLIGGSGDSACAESC